MTIIAKQRSTQKTHELKTWVKYFEAIVHPNKTLRKTLEIRKNDRNFNVGDLLVLREYDELSGYTGRQTIRRVTHILSGSPWVPKDYIAMSIIDAD